GFDNACRYLSTERPITGQLSLVPVKSCQAVIEAMSVAMPPIGEERGRAAVAAMLTAYPNAVLKQRSSGEVDDLKAYQRRMAKVMAMYCEQDCAAVIRPGTGLPSRLAFLPTEKELKDALEAEAFRRALIVFNAKAHVREGVRRAAEAEHDAKIEAERRSMTPEQRAARADAIVARLKINTMSGSNEAAA
ncbi:MAG: hypothetical protein ABL936_25505, partial [Aestuariivirga sp.]